MCILLCTLSVNLTLLWRKRGERKTQNTRLLFMKSGQAREKNEVGFRIDINNESRISSLGMVQSELTLLDKLR